MLLKVKISKAFPAKSIAYGAEKNILEKEIRRNLFSKDLTPADEMLRTAHQIGKWKDEKERKTFSLIISPDPKDCPTEEQLIDVTCAVLDNFFPLNQGVIVLHKDKAGTADEGKYKAVLHSHFYGSIINPLTGKNLHISQKDLFEIRQWAEDYAKIKFGWTPLKKARELTASTRYRRDVLRILNQRGKYSWRLTMTAIIEKQYSEATSFEDFVLRLQENGIKVFFSRKNKKTGAIVKLPELKFSFTYRNRTMVVNADTISGKLTLKELKNKFQELGEKNYGENYRRTEETGKIQWVGKGPYPNPTRENCGQGYVGKSGKLDYDCIICSRDKLVCKDCSRDEIRGGTGHERNGRTR